MFETQSQPDDGEPTGDGTGGPTYNPYDRDPPRCGRRCKDGSVCDRLVPLAGVACHHHMDQAPVSADQVADD